MTKNRTEELPEELKGEITPEKLIQSQKEDSDIKVISDYKNINVKPGWQDISRHGNKVKSYWNQWDSLEFRNGILCRKYENIPGDEVTWQIVLPKALKKVVMEQLHNNITSGHLGIKKTLARVTNRFYWYGLRSDVEHWCKTCDICASRPKEENNDGINYSTYAKRLQEKVESIHSFARRRIYKSSDLMKKCHDRNVNHISYEVGDAVWLYEPRRKVGFCPKLYRPWNGPFIITKKLNDVIYRIQKGPKNKPKVIHHNRLKRYNGKEKPTWFKIT
ncbi:unnamed protein product [Mytilus edulis]|uniref:Integrase zinc-binding domain-containing protein n=1 Tax=Mytilus edulis TaxID=6550 RepID=A0A8S3Q075_MYTED|nr:unnamed protein product [Mytilus edulis]